jgi:hypothetical protein
MTERRRAHGIAAVVFCLAAGFDGTAGRSTSPPSAAPASLARACAFLWSAQAEDGGWHSHTYGLMRSGQALTPFILHALLTAPGDACPVPPDSRDRALEFLRRHVGSGGQLGADDPDLLEYPNYATAYALRCFVRVSDPKDRPLVERMRDRLVREQFAPASGFDEDTLVFGGWGFGGTRSPGRPGHMDLSHTRKVLQALREAGTDDAAVYARALVFLRLMQRHPSETRRHPTPLAAAPARAGIRFDGGFFFSPVVLDANKGAVLVDEQGAFHGSYATATCDGLLALLAAGLSREDERVRAARDWLLRHPRLDRPDGVPTDSPQAWDEALDFYHLAVRAEAYAAIGLSDRMSVEVPRILGPRQRADGGFVNDRNHLMKEDDPLLATALAVVALT